MLAVFSVVAFAQEKLQNTEKHACTETCDHVKSGAKSEMKVCCSAAKGEGEEYGHCKSEKSAAAMVSAKKTCCSEGKSNETTAVAPKKAYCSEKKSGSADSGKE